MINKKFAEKIKTPDATSGATTKITIYNTTMIASKG